MSLFTLERVSGPDIEPVTLAQMKLHLREFSGVTAQDDAITALIKAGREWVEDFTGRVLVDQTWKLTVGDYVPPFSDVDSDTVTGYYRGPTAPRADGGILLRKSPVMAITAFVSVDSLGAETAISAATYELREASSKWPRVVPLTGANWMRGLHRITYRAGYADQTSSPQTGAEVVPERYKQAIKLWVEANYDRDEKMMALLLDAAERVIRPEIADLSIA